MSENGNKITDHSGDRKYFTITPRLVWALSETTEEYTLWGTVKDIAGEEGECFLSTEDLALLSMMSSGTVSKYRKILIDKGLLKGEIKRDPGYPQPVWHLSIPDLWDISLKWSLDHISLKERIEFKRSQKAKKKSLREMKPSRDEGGIPTDEGGIPTDETKKKEKKNQKEEPFSSGEPPKKTRKKSAYILAMEAGEIRFAVCRGIDPPDWQKANQTQIRGFQTNWRQPLNEFWKSCKKDTDRFLQIIDYVVRDYVENEKKDPKYPMVTPRSFKTRFIAASIEGIPNEEPEEDPDALILAELEEHSRPQAKVISPDEVAKMKEGFFNG